MLSQQFIENIKKKLLGQKKKLEERLSHFAHKNKEIKGDYNADFPDYGDKDDENAGEVATYDDNLSLERSLEKSLRDVEKTLVRIDKGEYGICKYCGQDIGEKRLLARPASSACVSCKEKLTSR